MGKFHFEERGITLIGGVVDDTSTDTLDEGDAGYIRSTTDRKLIVEPQGSGFELLASETDGIVITPTYTEVLEVTDCHFYRDIIFLVVNSGTGSGADDDENIDYIGVSYDRPIGSGQNVPAQTNVDVAPGSTGSSWVQFMAQLSGYPLGLWPFPTCKLLVKSTDRGSGFTGETTVKAWAYGRRI